MLQYILDECDLHNVQYEPVYGGDINRCWCVRTKDSKYFLKVNDATLYPRMFEKEATGLNALHDQAALSVPGVLKYGSTNDKQYLLLEWVDAGSAGPVFWDQFGAGLAMLHQHPQPYFGWSADNYIGTLTQLNPVHDNWHTFYSECRILPLARKLVEEGSFSTSDLTAADRLCSKLDQLFPPEPPSILHGDLWRGNFLTSARGDAVVFDPAVYYGHREMDIAMTRLFGGFDLRFYHAYNESYPLQTGWEERMPLAQLYPLLVHALLFDGQYVTEARQIIMRFA